MGIMLWLRLRILYFRTKVLLWRLHTSLLTISVALIELSVGLFGLGAFLAALGGLYGVGYAVLQGNFGGAFWWLVLAVVAAYGWLAVITRGKYHERLDIENKALQDALKHKRKKKSEFKGHFWRYEAD